MITIVQTKATLMSMSKIVLRNGDKYFYTTAFRNVENPIGVIKATLKEYTIYKIEDSEIVIGKLHKTNKGDWYDLTTEISIDSILATSLKKAIDETEKSTSLSNVLFSITYNH